MRVAEFSTRLIRQDSGIASKIKYFNLDSRITRFQLFEYDSIEGLSKISNHKLSVSLDVYKFKSFGTYIFKSKDTIVEYRNFVDANYPAYHEVYIYDQNRNIKEKLCYALFSSYPYLSEEYYYSEKKERLKILVFPHMI